MSAVLQQLFHDGYRRHVEFRRLDSCFHAFSGALIEAFRERNYRLVGFDTLQAGGALTVSFEQPDGDRICLRLEPYRQTQTFLRSIGPVAEMVCTFYHHVDDPDVITAAQAAMLRQGMGRLLGTFSSHDNLQSGAALSEPGNLRFTLHGSEVVATLNLILNLKDYALGDLDFDKDKLGQSLDAMVYGLEKFVVGILERHSAPG